VVRNNKSTKVELELVKIDKQLFSQQETISLEQADGLFSKAEKEVKNVENSEITEEIQEEVMKIFLKMLGLVGNCGDK
jgi:hypothetical protein